MEEKIIQLLKSRQLSFDPKKAEAEHDPIIRSFIDHLLKYPEAWNLLFDWKDEPQPLIIVRPLNFDYDQLRDALFQNTTESYFVRNFTFSFSRQYRNFSDPKKIKRVNEFLKKALDADILISRSEVIFFCLNCGKIVITNRVTNERKCICGDPYDFSFRLARIPDNISHEIISGHLLELFALRVLERVKGLRLVGMNQDGREIYTSIQYEGAGAGENINAEFDILGVKGNILLMVECKFNRTKYGDIQNFLKASDNLYYQLREQEPRLKIRKIIFSFDATGLLPIENCSIISLQKVQSVEDMIKEIRRSFELKS